MPSHMKGPRAKAERAKQHVQELQAVVGEFFATNPYEVVTDEDSEPGKRLYKLSRVDPPPDSLGLIAGDAIHNLRSALDHLFCQLVLKRENAISRTDTFPIADSAKLFKTGGLPKIKRRIPDEAVELICRLKPYKGGNDALWRLHRLDIVDKHRVLYVVGSAYRAFRPRFPPFEGLEGNINLSEAFPNLFLRPADRMFPLKEGDALYAEPIDFESQDEPQFRFDVAFGESEVVEGEPIVEALNDLVSATEQTIELFSPLL